MTASIKLHIARIVSMVFRPEVWILLLLFAAYPKSGLTAQQLLYLGPLMLFLLVGLPFIWVYIAQKKHWISAWDMPKRKERYGFFAGYILTCVIAFLIIKPYLSVVMLQVSTILFAYLLITAAITFFWKISVHMGVTVLSVILINFFLDWQVPILFLAIPLVYRSRRVLNRHTHAQLIAGFLVSAAITLGGLYLFGYI